MPNIKCPYCGSSETSKNGSANGTGYRYCPKCNKYYSDKTVINKQTKKELYKEDCLWCGGSNTFFRVIYTPTNNKFYYCYDCKRNFSTRMILLSKEQESKRCIKCGEIKLISDFYKQRINKQGFLSGTSICKECCNEIRFKRYGITKTEFKEMIYNQNHLCLICGTLLDTDTSTKSSIDHCHKTGIIRGILCVSCNKLIGFARDDIRILENAIFYLKKYK
jgi:hypothetical protein